VHEEAGSLKETVACWVPTVAVTEVGAQGTVGALVTL
jgi:hypothetical protein